MGTVGEWLEGLAETSKSEDQDSNMMENLLHKVGFPEARVVVGIAYLEGKDTMEAPPMSIHQVAKMLVSKAYAEAQ